MKIGPSCRMNNTLIFGIEILGGQSENQDVHTHFPEPFLMAETSPSILASPEVDALNDDVCPPQDLTFIASRLVSRIRYQQSLEREIQTLLWAKSTYKTKELQDLPNNRAWGVCVKVDPGVQRGKVEFKTRRDLPGALTFDSQTLLE